MATGEYLSLAEIQEALHVQGDPWQAGVTRVSIWPPDARYRLAGARPPAGVPTIEEIRARLDAPDADHRERAAARAVGLTAAYDLRDVDGANFITPVKDQDHCGSDVVFSVIAAIEGRLRKQRNNPALAFDLSEAHLLFVHGRAAGEDCATGWWPDAALEACRTLGVVDEACYPYDLAHRDGSTLCADAEQRLTKIAGYTALGDKPADIKAWLVERGPVSAVMLMYEDFLTYRGGIYRHVTGDLIGGHAVTIVGYDDSARYWICKNSWSAEWGDRGFFNIAYGECALDSWSNHGVDAVVNTGWNSASRVVGLWGIDEDRNAWACFEALGWRKVSTETDAVFYQLLSDLIAAKAAARPVDFYEEDSVIKQVYIA